MNLLNLLKSKTGLLLLASIFLVGIVILFLVLIFRQPATTPKTQPSPTNTPVRALGNYPEVLNIQPSELAILTAGVNQVFTITLKTPITPSKTTITLTKQNYTTNQNASSTPITISYSSDASIITVTPKENIEAFSQYVLTITDSPTNTILLLATYNSRDIKPTKPQNNNLQLKSFLPHETTSYKLSFNELRGVYVFNFKINPNSTANLNAQYESAKKEAEDFIKSKGIDLNTIVIEWRHS